MISKEEYMQHIKEMLKEEEQKDIERLKIRDSNKKSNRVIVVLVFLIVVIPAFIIHFAVGIIAFFVWLFTVALSKETKGKSRSYYKKEYREKALAFLLKDIDCDFDENGQISEQLFRDSQLCGEFSKLMCKDKLSVNIPNDDGSKSECYLTMCDLKATKEETVVVSNSVNINNSFRRTTTKKVDVEVYRGAFGYIEFPFEFKCLMCINSNYKKKGVVVRDVVLEDTIFNKKFKIWCDDQIEARYILTPDMMEKLLYLNEKLKGLNITLVDNKMYMGIWGKDWFELAGNKENPETFFERIYDDISLIMSLVDEIKNNNKIFKM